MGIEVKHFDRAKNDPASSSSRRIGFHAVIQSVRNEPLSFLFITGLIAGTISCFIFLTLKIWGYTIDDAFISLKYAYNLSRGWGLVYNPKPFPPAEGYTSFLWVVIMAVPHFFNISAVFVSKILGLLFTAATAITLIITILSFNGESLLPSRLFGAIIAALLFLSFPYSSMHAVSGMETALASFLYTITAALAIGANESRFCRLLLPLSAFLLGLTRPEANLFNIAILGITFFAMQTKNRGRFTIYCFSLYVFPGVLYFLWRYDFYRTLFPLSFYIKSNDFSLAGLDPAFSFITRANVICLIPLLYFLFLRKPVLFKKIIIPFGLIFGYLLTVNHISGYGDRYFFPLLPTLCLMGGIGITILLSELDPEQNLKGRTTTIAVTALILSLGFAKGLHSIDRVNSYSNGLKRAHILLGTTLGEMEWHKNDPVLVIGDAGAVPYFSRMTTIDSFGLNDPFIAKNFQSERSHYIFSINPKPTLLVFISRDRDKFVPILPHEDNLYKSTIKNNYTAKAKFFFNQGYFLWAMYDPEAIDGRVLGAKLSEASKLSFKMSM